MELTKEQINEIQINYGVEKSTILKIEKILFQSFDERKYSNGLLLSSLDNEDIFAIIEHCASSLSSCSLNIGCAKGRKPSLEKIVFDTCMMEGLIDEEAIYEEDIKIRKM